MAILCPFFGIFGFKSLPIRKGFPSQQQKKNQFFCVFFSVKALQTKQYGVAQLPTGKSQPLWLLHNLKPETKRFSFFRNLWFSFFFLAFLLSSVLQQSKRKEVFFFTQALLNLLRRKKKYWNTRSQGKARVDQPSWEMNSLCCRSFIEEQKKECGCEAN